MADSGKASKVVVKKLVDDIVFFADKVKEFSGEMFVEADNLQVQWNDPQYLRFLSYMKDLTDSLTGDTAKLYDCADKITERELKGI